MALIVIVAQEGELFEFLGYVLQKEGFEVKFIRDAKVLSPALRGVVPKMILLESGGMLPNVEETCARIRSWGEFRKVRIVVIGPDPSLDAGTGRRACRGADAFLTRPLHPRAVVAEIKALLRGKAAIHAQPELTVGDLTLEPVSYRAARGGRRLRLTAREFRLLYFLVSNPNTVWSREHLLGVAWPMAPVTTRTVDVFIRRLRQHIEECPEKPVRIVTEHGDGYSFQVPT